MVYPEKPFMDKKQTLARFCAIKSAKRWRSSCISLNSCNRLISFLVASISASTWFLSFLLTSFFSTFFEVGMAGAPVSTEVFSGGLSKDKALGQHLDLSTAISSLKQKHLLHITGDCTIVWTPPFSTHVWERTASLVLCAILHVVQIHPHFTGSQLVCFDPVECLGTLRCTYASYV